MGVQTALSVDNIMSTLATLCGRIASSSLLLSCAVDAFRLLRDSAHADPEYLRSQISLLKLIVVPQLASERGRCLGPAQCAWSLAGGSASCRDSPPKSVQVHSRSMLKMIDFFVCFMAGDRKVSGG